MVSDSFSPELRYETSFLTSSINLVARWLESTWALEFPDSQKLDTRISRNVDDLRSFQNDLDGAKIGYPLVQLIITSVEVDGGRGGFARKYTPMVFGRSDSSDHLRTGYMLPVKVGLGATLRADSLEDIVQIVHLLGFSAPRVTLRVQNEYGFAWENGLSIEGSLTIPSADLGNVAKEYRFETSFILDTWMLRTKIQGVIRHVVFTAVDSGGVSTPLGTFDSLDTLINRGLHYTDIVDKASTSYKYE